MIHTAPPLTCALLPDAPASAAAGAVRPVIERQLALLGRLAEIGLNIAAALERQATDPAAAAAPAEIGLAYSRVARAVRLTVMLQSRAIQDLQALDRGDRAPDDRARRELAHARKLRIQRIVGRIAGGDGRDEDEVERLGMEVRERLEADEIYGDVLARPTSEIVAWICRELGLSPDWPGLAEEAWAQDEIAGGAAGSPLAALLAAGPGADIRRSPPHAGSP